ncbi:MAG: hypothetical protein QOH16_706 [Gaiellaceae bacterium]|nr:hypothetical protein [Gaiellaceae bacterium]
MSRSSSLSTTKGLRCARTFTLLLDHLREQFPFPFGVVIADNASADAAWEIARAGGGAFKALRTPHVRRKSRGLARRSLAQAAPKAASKRKHCTRVESLSDVKLIFRSRWTVFALFVCRVDMCMHICP